MWRAAIVAFLVVAGLVVGAGVYLAGNIYLRDGHLTVPDDALEDRIPVDRLREDLAVLVEVFDETHIDFAAINGPAYTSAVRELSQSLDAPMTRAEFYSALAPLNSLLADGHTSLLRLAEELDLYERSGGLFLPLTVDLRDGDIRVSRSFDSSAQLQPGDRLIAINGVPADSLAETALSHESGENAALRRVYAERGFYRTLVLLGVESPFAVDFQRGGITGRAEMQGMTRPEYVAQRDARSAGQNAFEILDGNIGLLTFSDMPSQLAEFRRFLRTAFAELAAQEVETLIIDIRANGGGDSRAGDQLLRYIADRDYPALERVDVNVTDRIKAYYDGLLPPLFRWIPLERFVPVLQNIERTPSGNAFVMHPDGERPVDWRERPEHAFEGDLVILIGPATYSSAAIFAAPLRHYGLATFIGEETGEPAVFFGENYIFDLPNSRLQAAVSHKSFDLVGDGDHTTGIQPHIQTDAAAALDAALVLIRNRGAESQ